MPAILEDVPERFGAAATTIVQSRCHRSRSDATGCCRWRLSFHGLFSGCFWFVFLTMFIPALLFFSVDLDCR